MLQEVKSHKQVQWPFPGAKQFGDFLVPFDQQNNCNQFDPTIQDLSSSHHKQAKVPIFRRAEITKPDQTVKFRPANLQSLKQEMSKNISNEKQQSKSSTILCNYTAILRQDFQRFEKSFNTEMLEENLPMWGFDDHKPTLDFTAYGSNQQLVIQLEPAESSSSRQETNLLECSTNGQFWYKFDHQYQNRLTVNVKDGLDKQTPKSTGFLTVSPDEKNVPKTDLSQASVMSHGQIRAQIVKKKQQYAGLKTMLPGSYEKVKLLNRNNNRYTTHFICKYEGCERVFSKSTSLIVHYWRHLNVRPFRCDLCAISFTQSGTLSRHNRAVHKVISTVSLTREQVESLHDVAKN